MSIHTQQIPVGWKVMKIADACEIINGKTPLRNNQDYWHNGDIPWFTVDDIRNQGRRINNTKQNISELGLKKSGVKLLPKNTVLICCTASVGEYAIATIPLTTNQQFNGLVIKDRKQISPDFLFQASAKFEKQLKFLMGTTAFGFVSKSQLGSIEFLVPPLDEQAKIAAILSKVDEEIEKVERIIEQSEKLKKGLMQKLLTKGIGHTKFKQSELGEIPEEWLVVRLGEIIDKLQAGVSVNSENRLTRANEIGILKTSAVTYGKFNPNEHKTVIEKDLDRVSTKVEGETIIISRMNTPLLVGANCYVDRDYNNLFLPDRLWKIVLKNINQISVLWLSYLLGHEDMREKIRQIATGTSASMKNISKEKFLNLSIVLPPLEDQKQIAKIAYSIDNKIFTNQKIKSHLIKLKKGLMNDLLSGRKRII